MRDRKSPVGYKTILNRVSGQFDWGKLSMILGAAESGKSSLLHFLAGDTGASSEIIGSLFFNKNKVDPKVPLWQRCSLVEAKDEHFRDLTVKDVITFSMRLRCTAIIAENLIEENVTKTVALLHLETLVYVNFHFLYSFFNLFIDW